MTKKLAESYKKAYGFWEVTTEGDCEGRSVSRLGIYEGYIDEIALALADRCYYSLCFRPIDPRALDLTPKRKSVEISFDIGSNTWDMDNEGISLREHHVSDCIPDSHKIVGTSQIPKQNS